jgi:phosphoribosyl 1,2-cyclic phosphate phosphodiesterase
VSLRFTILGCGSSPGVPRINGDWGACDPNEPRNRRLRCSLLVERVGPMGVTTVVIDTGPDFRQQMLSANVRHIDAVLYTHAHADHIHGIDDLRSYAQIGRSRIRTYADAPTRERLISAFGYCYETPPGSVYPPILEMAGLEAGRRIVVDGQGGPLDILPIAQIHGPIASLGFRFGGDLDGLCGGLAYSPDISDLSPESEALLRDLDCWIVDALMYRQHLSHFSVGDALAWIGKLKPGRAVLTHMHTPLDYGTLKNDLPAHVEPAHDGMVLEMALPSRVSQPRRSVG